VEAQQLPPEGIVVFHEVDFANQIRSWPEKTIFGSMQSLIAETFRRAGL
jgi:hypothetical protein